MRWAGAGIYDVTTFIKEAEKWQCSTTPRGVRCGHCHAPPPDGAYPEGPDYEPEDGPLHSDSPCAGPGGACGCYGEGYAAGKDKAHFEVRALAEAQPHGRGCDCGPCQTSRALIAALVREAAHAGLCGCGLTGGLSAAPTMLATAAPAGPRDQPDVGRANAGGPRRQSRKGGFEKLMRVTYDGPDFGLGKLNNKRAFACFSVLADLGLLKVDEDAGMGWAEISIAMEELLVLVPQARGKYPQGPGL